MCELNFSRWSIFHQLWVHVGNFLGKKIWLIFHPLSSLISLSGWFPKAITAPWKWSLRVQWCSTFQLGPKKPPKPLLGKKIAPPNPKLHSQPSVHWKEGTLCLSVNALKLCLSLLLTYLWGEPVNKERVIFDFYWRAHISLRKGRFHFGHQ